MDLYIRLPKRPEPEAPADTVGISWDAYTGSQMLAYGRLCADMAWKAATEAERERCAKGCSTDGSGPLPARWYCVSNQGIATLCKDEDDARDTAQHCDLTWPGAPHRAVLLGDVAAEREACAKVAESYMMVGAGTIASAIRARGEK